ncbi:MAG: 2-oxoacid:acceptor oxidoreductase family protein [Symbiobacteriaceae bacterium]|nr:2-oxoacid:acceptor oxidoreductase family protein [Symbiobacteriaceae bacterium]
MTNIEIRISGSGGQGIITAGIILAEAAIICGKNALQSQSYGPEARGGASRAEVIISDSEIDYPKVTAPNIFIALTQQAYEGYKSDLVEDAVILVDSSISATANHQQKLYQLPILETAQSKLRPVVANIIALSALVRLTSCVSPEALEQAVLARVPRGTEEMNKNALLAGADLVDSLS